MEGHNRSNPEPLILPPRVANQGRCLGQECSLGSRICTGCGNLVDVSNWWPIALGHDAWPRSLVWYKRAESLQCYCLSETPKSQGLDSSMETQVTLLPDGRKGYPHQPRRATTHTSCLCPNATSRSDPELLQMVMLHYIALLDRFSQFTVTQAWDPAVSAHLARPGLDLGLQWCSVIGGHDDGNAMTKLRR
jgi:hypothetical protein